MVRSYINNSKDVQRYQDYWKTASGNSTLWLKAITGRANYRMMIQWTVKTVAAQISKAVRRRMVVSNAKHAASELHALTERGVRLLFVYSARDPGLDYFRVVLDHEMRTFITGGTLRVEIIPQADHLFTLLWHQECLLHSIHNWVVMNRGRDASFPAPPAQIRTGSFPAYGSYLGCLASNRLLGWGCTIRGLGLHRLAKDRNRDHVSRWRWPRRLKARNQYRSTSVWKLFKLRMLPGTP